MTEDKTSTSGHSFMMIVSRIYAKTTRTYKASLGRAFLRTTAAEIVSHYQSVFSRFIAAARILHTLRRITECWNSFDAMRWRKPLHYNAILSLRIS